MSETTIERHDLFVHKKRGQIAVINSTSVTGEVNYRIKGARRCYFSKPTNFLKNWKRLEYDTKPQFPKD